MSAYWVNFAARGDPNGKGLLVRPVFDPETEVVMGFGDKVEVTPLPHKAELDLWDAYSENQRRLAR